MRCFVLFREVVHTFIDAPNLQNGTNVALTEKRALRGRAFGMAELALARLKSACRWRKKEKKCLHVNNVGAQVRMRVCVCVCVCVCRVHMNLYIHENCNMHFRKPASFDGVLFSTCV